MTATAGARCVAYPHIWPCLIALLYLGASIVDAMPTMVRRLEVSFSWQAADSYAM